MNIGTAGHVDHGKTRLVLALTGKDTDRLKEEKQRGISIQLGFAPLVLPSGRCCSVVDVPGHERFVKTMTAGAAGLDMVLFLMAADEGIRPQTREHLEILTLLGINQGVAVLSKADLADEEGLALAGEEFTHLLQGSSLADAPMVAVSAHTGAGLAELLAAIDRIAAALPPRPLDAPPRLGVDRVFSVPGFGTVAAGSLVQGRLEKGQKVEIINPQGQLEARIRFLEVHGERREAVLAGERAAINLAGVEKGQIPLGSWLAQPGLLNLGGCWDVSLQLLPHAPSLRQGARLHLYAGTGRTLARLRLVDREILQGGEECLCQLILESPLAALKHDRFIIRSFSPVKTIGGGSVFCGNAPRLKRCQALAALNLAAQEEPLKEMLGLLEPRPLTLEQAAAAAGESPEKTAELLGQLRAEKRAVFLGEGKQGLYLSAQALAAAKKRALAELAAFHQRHPLRQGALAEALRSKAMPDLPPRLWQDLLKNWAAESMLEEKAGLFALPGFQPGGNRRQKAWRQQAEELYLAAFLSPPSYMEIAKRLHIPPGEREELWAWFEGDFLLRAGEGIFFHRRAVEKAQKLLLAAYGKEQIFSLAEARDLLQTSRKYALLLLEYLDACSFTQREGEGRRIL